jgi:large subunit ribosomal protein L21
LHFLTGRFEPVITAPVSAIDAAVAPRSCGLAADRQQNRLQGSGPDKGVGLLTRLGRGRQMFAVFKTGGKQYRVAAEDVIKVGKVKGEPGEIVEFGEVLVVGGDNLSLGAPTVSGAMVAAEVLEQARGPKIIAFKKRRRKNSRRKIGHRQEFTLLRITEILTDGKKPSKQAQPRPKRAAVASDAGAETAAPAPKASARKAEKPKSAAREKKPAAKGPSKGKKKS